MDFEFPLTDSYSFAELVEETYDLISEVNRL